jgi:hypothetical protein
MITANNTLTFDDMPTINEAVPLKYANKIHGLEKMLKTMRNQAPGSQRTVSANTRPQKAVAAK